MVSMSQTFLIVGMILRSIFPFTWNCITNQLKTFFVLLRISVLVISKFLQYWGWATDLSFFLLKFFNVGWFIIDFHVFFKSQKNAILYY